MAEIKAHLQEVLESLREFVLSLNPIQCVANEASIIRHLQALCAEAKKTLKRYRDCLSKFQRLESLRLEVDQRTQLLQSFATGLRARQQELRQATPSIDIARVSARDVVHLAYEIPFTLHQVPKETQIQDSLLRTMPYNTPSRMPQPIVQPEDAKKGTEIVISPSPGPWLENSYIRYTMDGSVPTSMYGLIYDPNNKPKIEKNIILKCILCHIGRLDSLLVCKRYIVDENDNSLVINTQPSVWEPAVRPHYTFEGHLALSETPSETPSRPPSCTKISVSATPSGVRQTPSRDFQADSNPNDFL